MTRRVVGKGIWLSLGSVLTAAALVAGISWSSATSSLSAQAGRLDSADLALGSAAVTRAGAAQAVVMAVNYAAGTASSGSFAESMLELGANADAYRQVATAGGIHRSVFADSADQLLSLLQSGAVDDARAVLEGPMQVAYAADVDFLSDVRRSAVEDIDRAASFAGSVSILLRIAAVIAVPIAAAGIVHVMARRRLRAERRQLLEVVQEMGDKAAVAEEIVADASHRLRTPLTSIYGLSEVLAQSKRVTGLERELATLVHAEAAEMYRVADDVLVRTQMRSGSVTTAAEIVALPAVIDEATKPARSSGFEIKVECPEVWVLSDRTKLSHLIRNLVSNAVTHGAEPVFVEVSEVDGRVECLVIDHGPGLPEDVQPEEGRFGAAGNGLEIAYRLSDRIGAKLSYGRDGGQTRFCLSFTDEGPGDATTSSPGAE